MTEIVSEPPSPRSQSPQSCTFRRQPLSNEGFISTPPQRKQQLHATPDSTFGDETRPPSQRTIVNRSRDHWSDFQGKVPIGHGNSAAIYKAVHKATKEVVVLKKFSKHSMRMQKLFQGFLSREKWCLEKLKHRGLVCMASDKVCSTLHLDGCSFLTSKGNAVILQEYANKGDLFYYVQMKEYLDEQQARTFFYELLEAVSHLHQKGIAHLDIKLENVFLYQSPTGKLNVKLGDFGFAKVAALGDDIVHVTDTHGTEDYMSPERLTPEKGFDGPQSDMWSMGVLLFTILTGFPPMGRAAPTCPWFVHLCKGSEHYWGEVERILKRNMRPVPSKTVQKLITNLMEPNPSERWSAESALKYLRNVDPQLQQQYGSFHQNKEGISPQ